MKQIKCMQRNLHKALEEYIAEFLRIMDGGTYGTHAYSVGDDPLDVLCIGDYYFFSIHDVVDVVNICHQLTHGITAKKKREIATLWVRQQVDEWYWATLDWLDLQNTHPEEYRDRNFLNIRAWLGGAPRQEYLDIIKKFKQKQENNNNE